MGALRAIKEKAKIRQLPVRARKATAAPKGKAKVIKLPLHRRKSKAKTLTERQREALVVEHRPKAQKLGRSILRKWHARLDLEEVDSLVDLSLCEAVRRFNPNKGASFMTFLYYHLRGNLIRAVAYAANANSVPLPSNEYLDGEHSEHSHRRASHPVTSAMEVAEALCGNEHPLPDEVLFRKEMIDLSHQACGQLDKLEQEVINGVYLEGRQLIDVAAELGYSRCHISRVKRRALETLFSELRAQEPNQEYNIEDEEELPARKPVTRRGAQRRRLVRSSLEDIPTNVLQIAC